MNAAARSLIERRLLALAAVFLGIHALILALSPAVLVRSWQTSLDWPALVMFVVWLALFGAAAAVLPRWLPQRDPLLLPLVALASGWGLLTIWRLYPQFAWRQALWLGISMAILLAGARLPSDLGFLRRYKYLWLSGGLLLTGLTLFFGANPSGPDYPRLWLGCCGLYIQPSEPLKLLLLVYLAAYLADRVPHLASSTSNPGLTALIPPLAPTILMTGFALILLIIQRDLGTASIFLFLYAAMIYIATGRKLIVAGGSAAILAAGVAGYYLFDVVRLRIEAWINPWLDPSGNSYQIVQSLIAVANGGVIGRGPGLGSPQLVPVALSDFIFSAIAEETGLAGSLAVLIILAFLVQRGLRAAFYAADAFQRFLAAGLTAYLAAQSILIIGGNLRLLPLTGVTLPFFSYGGSSLVTSFITLLLLLQISSAERRPARLTNPRPYLEMGGVLIGGICIAAAGAGWWAVARSPALLARTDNPRRALGDLYVPRGNILDRSDALLVQTVGSAGSFSRQTLYPALSATLGYSEWVYGQAGLEASLDAYLRGLQGHPAQVLWWNHFVYGQTPPGLPVRLSLDLPVQRAADQTWGDAAGAAVLINASNGEILALVSHPTFDANHIAETWEAIVQDPGAPLLNRATQGAYPPGAALSPFLLTEQASAGELPEIPRALFFQQEELLLPCAVTPSTNTWPALTAAGCPGAAAELGSSLGSDALIDLFERMGLYTTPDLPLPVVASPAPAALLQPDLAALGLPGDDGQPALLVTPLHMAFNAAVFSNAGLRPAPKLALAVKTPEEGWVSLENSSSSQRVFSPEQAIATTQALSVAGLSIWESLASAPNGEDRFVTWYLAGTRAGWSGTPLALAVLLEEDNPALAREIGRAILDAAIFTPVG